MAILHVYHGIRFQLASSRYRLGLSLSQGTATIRIRSPHCPSTLVVYDESSLCDIASSQLQISESHYIPIACKSHPTKVHHKTLACVKMCGIPLPVVGGS
jgi:hypothetical protein